MTQSVSHTMIAHQALKGALSLSWVNEVVSWTGFEWRKGDLSIEDLTLPCHMKRDHYEVFPLDPRLLPLRALNDGDIIWVSARDPYDIVTLKPLFHDLRWAYYMCSWGGSPSCCSSLAVTCIIFLADSSTCPHLIHLPVFNNFHPLRRGSF